MGKLLGLLFIVGLAVVGADVVGTDVLGGEARKQWCLATMDHGYCGSPEFRAKQSQTAYEARVARERGGDVTRIAGGHEQEIRRATQAAVSNAQQNDGYFDEQRCVNDIVNSVSTERSFQGQGLSEEAFTNLQRLARARCSETGRQAATVGREAVEIGKDLGAIAGEGARALREIIRR